MRELGEWGVWGGAHLGLGSLSAEANTFFSPFVRPSNLELPSTPPSRPNPSWSHLHTGRASYFSFANIFLDVMPPRQRERSSLRRSWPGPDRLRELFSDSWLARKNSRMVIFSFLRSARVPRPSFSSSSGSPSSFSSWHSRCPHMTTTLPVASAVHLFWEKYIKKNTQFVEVLPLIEWDILSRPSYWSSISHQSLLNERLAVSFLQPDALDGAVDSGELSSSPLIYTPAPP